MLVVTNCTIHVLLKFWYQDIFVATIDTNLAFSIKEEDTSYNTHYGKVDAKTSRVSNLDELIDNMAEAMTINNSLVCDGIYDVSVLNKANQLLESGTILSDAINNEYIDEDIQIKEGGNYETN